jgi:putative ABC transport system substrate-binding protein
VGVLAPDIDPDVFAWKDFVAELSRRGYSEGINLVFERPSARMDRAADLDRRAAELVKSNVDVIYAEGGTPGALAAKKATSTIPIVFLSSADPVGMGIVQSLSRPGGNLTGSSIQYSGTTQKELQLLAEATGKLTSLVYLHPADARSQPSFSVGAAARVDAANALGIRVQDLEYGTVPDIEPTLRRLIREGVDGAGVLTAGFDPDASRSLAALLIKVRLPSLGNPADGYLLSYGNSVPEIARVAAKHVDQVLQGAKPADLPIEQVMAFELKINLRTAKAIGLSVPSSVLIQATTLIQ